jgi:hypothetical protein
VASQLVASRVVLSSIELVSLLPFSASSYTYAPVILLTWLLLLRLPAALYSPEILFFCFWYSFLLDAE